MLSHRDHIKHIHVDSIFRYNIHSNTFQSHTCLMSICDRKYINRLCIIMVVDI